MNLTFKGAELELSFKTKNYEDLQEKLDTKNLRNKLLFAAQNLDYKTLAIALMYFAKDRVIKNYEDAYDIIDEAENKQEFFYELIKTIGDKGFFGEVGKKTIKELMEETPEFTIANIDMEKTMVEMMPTMIAKYAKSI